ncbi:oligopeptide ABC transporter substrate-binding protein [Paenibacillus wynnii]|uniref:oligopeptide ABC transporter substrate-binding protein n=1 Tax=Paenibacillus wynnii TaxID=268407 RepID=UPI0027947696|nr:oligopeptide ABC transporter substrate-binding protein [Paenibacillus wynnii]MDQ0193685.1 peptide/nickel transport system substrate-binding protein [Paenibacillus wynnii]
MNNKIRSGAMLMLLWALLLSACSGAATPGNSAGGDGAPGMTDSEGNAQPKAGGIITYGYSSPFQGLFEPAFYEGDDDLYALEFTTESMFAVKDDLTTVPNIATWQESEDHITFTFKIKPGVRWHNGDELTVEDWKFALEVIASPDYTGPRYYSVEMIQGVEAYHTGKATTISGLTVIDPYTLRITVTSARVNTIDNLWSYPMNKKYYTGIPVKEMEDSNQMRVNPIGIGPFKITSIKPGEYVEMKRFDDYYKGKPLLDGVLYKVFDDKQIVELFKQGVIDIEDAPRDAYKQLKNLDNVNLLQTPELSYEYIGFKFGSWNNKEEVIKMDNPKFADKRLRQAMYYALDRASLIKNYSYGLGKLVETPIPGTSWAKIPEDQINQYPYNPDKAKELLNEAGYIDIDKDGFREDPKGKPFVINYDGMIGSTMAESRTEAILQNWREVGLDVRLNGGTLKELNPFYDAVESDDPTIELFNGVWGLASDPDPSGLWRKDDPWNYPRWSSERNEELIRAGVSMKSYDKEYRKQVYYDWQKYINEEVPMIFVAERESIIPVNKRLQGVHVNSMSAIIEPAKWWIKDVD